MSYPQDLFPSGPSGPEYTAPLRQLILDGLALLITDHLLDTINCPACAVDALTCPDHKADAAIAEDCHAAYLHLAATGAS